MNSTRRRRLEKAGWTTRDAGDFVGLTPQGLSLDETKLDLAAGFRQRREAQELTQTETATSIVSVDLMMLALSGLGVSPKRVVRILAATLGRRAP